jgi:hypothetical protein
MHGGPSALARELYSGRPHVRMDVAPLCAGAMLGRQISSDTPDFRTLMAHLLLRGQPQPPIGDVPTIEELTSALQVGSTATSLDELPRPILQQLSGHGLSAAHHLLQCLALGHRSDLLSAVLHLPLRKKDPAWLLRNSRPVLLEPFLRRAEATIVFRAATGRQVTMFQCVPCLAFFPFPPPFLFLCLSSLFLFPFSPLCSSILLIMASFGVRN